MRTGSKPSAKVTEACHTSFDIGESMPLISATLLFLLLPWGNNGFHYGHILKVITILIIACYINAQQTTLIYD
jgi:hypothetical protein